MNERLMAVNSSNIDCTNSISAFGACRGRLSVIRFRVSSDSLLWASVPEPDLNVCARVCQIFACGIVGLTITNHTVGRAAVRLAYS